VIELLSKNREGKGHPGDAGKLKGGRDGKVGVRGLKKISRKRQKRTLGKIGSSES